MRWRRTVIAGRIVPDDWCLVADDGRDFARIYKAVSSPGLRGKWQWFVQVDALGQPSNGGTGYADSGREAREECEARVPRG
jgi:hypothetical protein